MPRRFARPLPLLAVAVGGLIIVAAVLLAADWWICLPEGKPAEYVGRGECARCHQEALDAWRGSDHDRAMELATPATVRGDFHDRLLLRVAFEELGQLADDDLRRVARHMAPAQWATALNDVPAKLNERILAALSAEDAAAVAEQLQGPRTVRPCDAATAQHEICLTVGRLAEAGEIRAAFAAHSRFSRRGEKFLVETDGPDGSTETFEVRYTFGVRPLQQYLVELPRGRVQCLPWAWDTERRQWFHLYPKEAIPHDDVLHWTGPLQNWNYMCAECHSTNLQKNYDPEQNAYHTSFSEIDVSCQACHGPGSLHVLQADSNAVFWDRKIGLALPRLKSPDARVEIETCAPCHCRRRVVYPGFTAGGKLLDYFMPQLLDTDLYYADGQILEEDYVYGSYIQSKMYDKGVRCSDCHEPHTARVKYADRGAAYGQPIDNRLCTDCHMGTHPAAKYDTPVHHHHPDSSKPGTRCVECHMPETHYMVVDPRRDHSLRVPRPDLTAWSRDAPGVREIPNACNGCHHDAAKGETPEWAARQLQKWYDNRPRPEHFAKAIAAGRLGRPEGEKKLEALSRREDVRAMVRATALVLLGQYTSRRARAAVLRGLEDPEELVRAAAVRSLEILPQGELARVRQIVDVQRQLDRIRGTTDRAQRRRLRAEINLPEPLLAEIERIRNPLDEAPQLDECLRKLVPTLRDPIRAVRTEAARVLSQVPRELLTDADRQAFEAALEEYMTGQQYLADQADAHVNMAVVYTNLRQLDRAEQAYWTAIRIDPESFRARNNLALFCNERGRNAEAEQQLRKAIELEQKWLAQASRHGTGVVGVVSGARRLLAEGHYSLGLLLAEDSARLEEAATELARAAELAPSDPRKLYNYGLALQRLDRPEDAERALRGAYDAAVDQQAGGVRDYLHALAVFYLQQGRWPRAAKCAEEMLRLRPDDHEAQAMLHRATSAANQGQTGDGS